MYITLHSQSLLGIVPLRSTYARNRLLGDRATSDLRRTMFCERKIYRYLPAHRRTVASSHRRTVSESLPTFIRYLFRSGNIVTIQFPLPRETKHPAEKRTLSGSIGGSIRFCYASQTSMGVGELIFKGIVYIIYYIEQIHGEIVVRSFVAIAPSSPVGGDSERLRAKGKTARDRQVTSTLSRLVQFAGKSSFDA